MYRKMFIAVLIILAVPLQAQTQISGSQSGTLGPGTYLVVGDISVESGDSLTILPGTVFLHTGNYKWLVSGKFSAIGTEADSILFLRQEPINNDRWGGLHFINGAPIAAIDYCVIDNCFLDFSMEYFASINIYNGGQGLYLKHSRVTNANMTYYGGGVYAKDASVLIDSCLISDNFQNNSARGAGIYLVGCNGAQIIHSLIGYNACDLDGS
jgi:hypothetical protein